MHLLSGLYRYAKQYDKAKDYAMKALTALDFSEPGQESSIANYVNACIYSWNAYLLTVQQVIQLT